MDFSGVKEDTVYCAGIPAKWHCSSYGGLQKVFQEPMLLAAAYKFLPLSPSVHISHLSQVILC